MDPDQTLSELFDSITDSDTEIAEEHATNLQEWLDRGGFAPLLRVLVDSDREFTLPPKMAKVICTSVIDCVQQKATGAKPVSPEV